MLLPFSVFVARLLHDDRREFVDLLRDSLAERDATLRKTAERVYDTVLVEH